MYAAKRLICGPGEERRDPTKQFYIKLLLYNTVIIPCQPRKTDGTSKPTVRKPAKNPAAKAKAAKKLPETMITGKASPAKAADGDKPVWAYIASLPQPQRGIAERVDVLAAKTLPGLQRSVKWGMSYYGVGDGWLLLLRWVREPRQAHVRKWRGAHAGTASNAGGDGQVHAGRGTRIRRRPGRMPDRGVDETSRGRARCRGKEAIGPEVGRESEGHVGARVRSAARG